MDDGLGGVVAKLDVLELHMAVAHGGYLGVCRLFFLGRGEELEDALGGCGHGLHRVAHVGQLLHGLGEVAHVLDEALDVAGGGIAGKGELGTHHDDGHVAGVAHERHERHHEAGEELRAPAGDKEAVVLLVELSHGLLGAVEDLNDVLTCEIFLDDAVHRAQHLLLLAEVGLREVHHHAHDHAGDGQRDDDDAGERQADGEHHHEHAHNLRDGGDELGHRLVEALAQRVDVVGDAAEHVALAVAVEVAHRHDGDLVRDLLAHAVADLLRDAGHEPALHEVAGRACQVEAQKQQQRAADPVKVDRSRARDLGHEALVEFGGDLAQDLGSHDVEEHGAHGESDGEEHRDLVLAHIAQELAHGALEVLGLLNDASGAVAAASHGAGTAGATLGRVGPAHIVCH